MFFDFYFQAVTPFELDGRKIADFSTPRFHEVVGFDDFPVQFPSIPEPYATLDQYLSFAGLKDGRYCSRPWRICRSHIDCVLTDCGG